MDGPLARSRALTADGTLNADPRQQAALEKLQILWRRLGEAEEKQAEPKPRGFFGFGAKAAKKEPPLNGLYLWGGVGRGKSMLMDMFFEAAPTELKRRTHFHGFMQEVHTLLKAERAKDTANPLPVVAKQVAAGAKLLCFDEMQVTDVADAMILGRLFEGLFAERVVIVSTSNRPPDDLYKDGLNRKIFLPFIDMLKQRLDVLHLDSETDHRLAGIERGGVYHAPLGPETNKAMDDLWRSLSGEAEAAPGTLTVHGRSLTIPLVAGRAARAGFGDLCAAALGAADYLAIAAEYDTVMLEDVPVMGPERRDQAKRFVTLIDALYEAKTRLVISADAEPDDLYVSGDGSFEFARTASRLIEMRSEAYLKS